MSLLSKWKWKLTKCWFPWEESVLRAVAERIGDRDFRKAFESQLAGLYEVSRGRQESGYYSWPAFLGNTKYFAESDPHTLATLTANTGEQTVDVTVDILGGGIYRINISGRNLPPPNRINLKSIGTPTVTLPVPKEVPPVTGWLKRLCDTGIVAPGDLPLPVEELEAYRQRFPSLPADYLEFCSQTEGGVILPGTADYAIFGLRDLVPAHTGKGQSFIPLVDLRELGGLGCLVANQPRPIWDFSEPEGTFFAKTFQAAIKKVAKEEMT